MSDNEARTKLYAVGLTIRGKKIHVYMDHPHTLRDEDGNIVETTKLTISNIPWSLNEQDIFDALDKLEVELMSDISPANCRSPADQSLTKRFYNAKLFAYIKKPKKVLPQFYQIGNFRAYLNYKEQLAETVCSNCLMKGHISKNCTNQTVCLDCHKEGHKRGDSQCRGKDKRDADIPTPTRIVSSDEDDIYPKFRYQGLSKDEYEEGELKSDASEEDDKTPNTGHQALANDEREEGELP